MITHSKPWITDDDRHSVERVLATGMLAQGGAVAKFEDAIAGMHGAAGGVATANGTAAVQLALHALHLGSGDEVILPGYVCISVLEAIRSVGATPVLCDIGPAWNMTVETVAKCVTAKTRAIIVVHIFGIAADLEPLRAFGVPLIEDCCQAIGARRNGKLVGTSGTISIFSFHATKCLATGEGGMAIANDKDLLSKMRAIRDGTFGASEYRIGSPMSDLQAALGLSQLDRYPRFLERRLSLANRYFLSLPASLTGRLSSVRDTSMFFRFPLFSSAINPKRDIEEFAKSGIAVRHGVEDLLHRRIGLSDEGFSSCKDHLDHTLSIPLYPSLSDQEQSSIIDKVLAWHAAH